MIVMSSANGCDIENNAVDEDEMEVIDDLAAVLTMIVETMIVVPDADLAEEDLPHLSGTV